MLSALRTGSFLTRQRALVYSALMLAGALALVVGLLATADGIVDRAGRPIGTDFANVYAAGRMTLEGRGALAYDWPAHHAVQKAISGRADIPYYGWHYPPMFLLVAAALALLPYLAALLLYQAVTLGACLAVVRQIAGTPAAWLSALAFPAVFVNLTHGQNGFLTAALLGGGLMLLERRPLLAGALIGCLAYKPQFALLIPLALMAGGHWRAMAAAAASATGLAVLTWVVLGGSVFGAFIEALPLAQKIAAEGAPGFHKIQSLYAALRLAGAPAGVASLAQVLLTLGVAGGVVALWRSAAAFELKAAGLLVGCLLATPYVLDYDLVVLAPAIAFLVAHGRRAGFAPYAITLLCALWMLPLVARPLAEATGVSIAPALLLAAFVAVLQWAGGLRAAGWRGVPAIAARR